MYTTLSEFSPAADVLECLLNAHPHHDDNCIIYDEVNDRVVTVRTVKEVIEQLRESNS